ncbi:Uncharacterized protein HZ326_13440 [Fusarium oxysporum f. sp. albedinis]|nr:Uncharacterized protein HZ326_13440 [Fusarium oxysporum f. sp. albedinis]
MSCDAWPAQTTRVHLVNLVLHKGLRPSTKEQPQILATTLAAKNEDASSGERVLSLVKHLIYWLTGMNCSRSLLRQNNGRSSLGITLDP